MDFGRAERVRIVQAPDPTCTPGSPCSANDRFPYYATIIARWSGDVKNFLINICMLTGPNGIKYNIEFSDEEQCVYLILPHYHNDSESRIRFDSAKEAIEFLGRKSLYNTQQNKIA